MLNKQPTELPPQSKKIWCLLASFLFPPPISSSMPMSGWLSSILSSPLCFMTHAFCCPFQSLSHCSRFPFSVHDLYLHTHVNTLHVCLLRILLMRENMAFAFLHQAFLFKIIIYSSTHFFAKFHSLIFPYSFMRFHYVNVALLYLFIVDGHLRWSCFLPIINREAMNMDEKHP